LAEYLTPSLKRRGGPKFVQTESGEFVQSCSTELPVINPIRSA
jgi:hypothetical protein